MARPVSFDESGDSEDLQALFDSIAVGAREPPPAEPDSFGDSDELQALFDTVVAQSTVADEPEPPAGEAFAGEPTEAMFNRLGHMTRQLHDSLRELGYDKVVEDTALRIPDARARLSYVAQMTEQAASKVLNATDIVRPIQDELLARSEAMGKRWEKMFANQLSVAEFKALAADSRDFFLESPARLRSANEQMTEIVLAQDFQDLTGQVIRKVVEMVQGLETQLLRVLVEAIPPERRIETPSGLLNGPVISAEGRSDVVTTQEQVDDLLESLGF